MNAQSPHRPGEDRRSRSTREQPRPEPQARERLEEEIPDFTRQAPSPSWAVVEGRHITEIHDVDDVRRVLRWLFDTAGVLARRKTEMDKAEALLRVRRAYGVRFSEGRNEAERTANGLISPGYQRALDDFQLAAARYEGLKAYRDAAELAVEVWRTIEATKRALKIS